MMAWWRIPVRSVLDVGAGKGYWRDWLADNRPTVRYHGVDASEHACRRYGHELADVATWEPRAIYDLVVCQSVLQYLGDRDATRALAALGAACRGVLLLEVPTTGDLDTVIDVDGTDMDVHWRAGSWYRSRLDRDFQEIGGGLWVSRRCKVPFFELERAATRGARLKV